MGTDCSYRMRAYYCFVEWLTTCSNLDEYALKLYSDDRNAVSSVETFCCLLSQSQGFQSLSFQPQGVLLKQICLYLSSHQLFYFKFIVLRINIISKNLKFVKNFELYFLSSSYFHYKKNSTKRDELHLYRFEFDLKYEIYNLLVTPLLLLNKIMNRVMIN